MSTDNIDHRTVADFGREWATFDQLELDPQEQQRLFDSYFALFPFWDLDEDAEGFDLGCGSGRWAALVAPKVGKLHCIDPAVEALAVCKRRLAHRANVEFHLASAEAIPLADDSQDFGYSLGVLHHIPNTARAMRDAVRKLRPGAPFLVYLYYNFENRPPWFRTVWRLSDLVRRVVAPLPFGMKKIITTAIAAVIYWPLARAATVLEHMGVNVANLPLSSYKQRSFYSLRTDALDRLGTRLEQRFCREDIRQMMEAAGLDGIEFSSKEPYWTACGRRRRDIESASSSDTLHKSSA